MENAMKDGTNPKEFKMRLAREIVTLYHGADAAAHAESQFTAVFTDGGVPEDITEVKAAKGKSFVMTEDLNKKIKVINGIQDVAYCIEDKALLKDFLDDSDLQDFEW